MKKILAGLLTIIVVAYLGICGFMYIGQRELMYLPDKRAINDYALMDDGFSKVTYEAEDGQKLFAFYRPANKSMPTVLFFHGNVGMQLYAPTKYQGLAKSGYGVLIASYRGFEGNDGKATQDGLRMDAEAAWNVLTKGLNLSPGEVVVYGESLGTGVAVQLVTDLCPDVKARAVILDAPFTSAVRLAQYRYPWLPVDILMLDKFDSIGRIKSVCMPLLVMNGTNDIVVPPSMGRELFDAASEPKEFVQLPGGNHADSFDFGARDVVDKFLAAHK